jgi:hypothetical protein
VNWKNSVPSSALLNSLDICPKQAQLATRLEREALSFHQLLTRGVEHGLQVDSDDPGKAASDEVMRLALSRPIETEQSDLLGLAEHCSALAEIVVWCLRTGPVWRHPAPLGDWIPSCFTVPGGLRRVVLCDRWDERRALQEMRDWRTLEGALYGLPVTIVAVVLGANRDGRRHGPLTKGWLHPRSQELRFRKRDGTGFDGNWEPVFRERYDGTRETWIEAMNADSLMTETFVIHPETTFDNVETERIRDMAQAKLKRIGEPAERNLSRCFDAVRPCEYRFPCAYFREPQEFQGFVKVSLPESPPHLAR